MKKSHNNSQYTNDRLTQQISKQLSLILLREVRDPRLGMVTITDVKITRDLSIVKVYITSFNAVVSSDSDDADQSSKNKNTKNIPAHEILNGMSSFLRTELASRIKMRSMPELRFYQDDSIATGNRIEELLDQIKKEQ